VARLAAPLVLVAYPCVGSFLRAVDEQAISYPPAARTILVLCHHKMISAELLGGGEDNIRA